MSDIRYSLCIAENDYNTNEPRTIVSRIADYDTIGHCFNEVIYSERDESDISKYSPPYIRAFASTLKPYSPEIRSWEAVSYNFV